MKRPFDLNKAIETWRSKLTDAEALRASDIAELETHLRDGFAELRDGGLSEDESFLIARRRLGGEELFEEFAKVNPNAVWAERGKWMLLGVLGFEVFWSALNIVCALVQMVVVRFVVGPAGSIWNQALQRAPRSSYSPMCSPGSCAGSGGWADSDAWSPFAIRRCSLSAWA